MFFPTSHAPVKSVHHVQFGILSPEEVIAYSVASINHFETFERNQRKIGGLLDPRMGCVDKTDRCSTCRSTTEGCPGHFGHIELARPLYHIGWQMTRVKKILETVCHHCSRIRLSPTVTQVVHGKGLDNQTSKTGPRDKWQEMMKLRKTARFLFAWRYGKARPACEWSDCGRQLLTLKKVRNKLQYDNGRDLDAGEAHAILKRISDEDWTLLGMDCVHARPEWMILTVLPVPPPAVRPSINMEGSGRGEDDLTHKLSDIIKYNKYVKNPTDDSSSKTALENIELLQYHVTTYIDNDVRGNDAALQKGGRPLRSLKSRLKGKEGRFRNNLMGKRVDFSARTVITGDPHLRVDEVGVPRSIASNLTFPEIACDINIEKLQALVDNRQTYPGAKYLIHDGRRRDLRYGSNRAIVRIGDTVERHLLDNDIAVFNRQPSLHKMSMMGHKVRVMPHSTFRLNLSVTTPYNADFDGDEMNLHIPQSQQTRAEIAHLAMVPDLIVSPQSNRPVCGIVQDALLGIYLMTSRDTFLDREALMDLCMYLPKLPASFPKPAIIKPIELWTGKQLFSMLLPETLSYSGYHSAHPEGERTYNSPGDTRVIIRCGELLCGIVCKRAIGPTAGGLVHLLWQDEGSAVVQTFMNGCQGIANQFLARSGFSVGIADGMISAAGLATVTETVQGAGKLVDDNMTRDSAGKVAQASLHRTNNFRRMVAAGSKGSSINISQISACVGPQNVEGKGIPRGFCDRTLPHFRAFDDSPSARGFVMNSYSRGLNPSEFFFHAMGGREGIIDTAVKTAETGYLQRKLVKALEDAMVGYDSLARNGRGHVIQFIYGEDGMDGTAIEKQPLLTLMLNNQQIADLFGGTPAEIQTLIDDRDRLRCLIPTLQDNIALPMNIKRLMMQAEARYPLTPTDGQPQDPLRQVNDLIKSLGLDEQSIFAMHIRSVLSTRQLTINQISGRALRWITEEVLRKYRKGLVHPGEMVGVVAAQSIGEPATQLTLNTFHLAGIGSKKVTLGIPRLKELLNTTHNIKTPSMTLHPREGYLGDTDKEHQQARLRYLKSEIEHVALENVLKSISIVHDPAFAQGTTTVAADRDWVELFLSIPDDTNPDWSEISPWMFRIVLNREGVWRHCLNMKTIVAAIQRDVGDDVWCIWSDDNDAELVIHFRMVATPDETPDPMPMETYLRQLQDQLLVGVTLKGIRGINAVSVEAQSVPSFLPDGNIDYVKEVTMETEGINISDVCSLPDVDGLRVTCNNPVEILQFLGIEAARAVLLKEIRKVIEFDGSYINARHLMLLSDVMTTSGSLMAITRHGINRTDAGPLAKSSFEETNDILFNAAADSERDDMQGVSESLIFGQMARLGTGVFEVV